MKTQPPIVELLVNPFCMAHRDVDSIRRVCNERGVALTLYNLWEIDDAELDPLPPHLALLIREWRSGQRPGSVYANIFVNGRRIPLNAWHEHLKTVSEAIAAAQREGAP